jgi:hypothetical protein
MFQTGWVKSTENIRTQNERYPITTGLRMTLELVMNKWVIYNCIKVIIIIIIIIIIIMLAGKPEGKRPLGRPRRRWVDNIKIDLR